jgi:hypothetical protein
MTNLEGRVLISWESERYAITQWSKRYPRHLPIRQIHGVYMVCIEGSTKFQNTYTTNTAVPLDKRTALSYLSFIGFFLPLGVRGQHTQARPLDPSNYVIYDWISNWATCFVCTLY